MNDAASKSFLSLSPAQQHAELRAQRAAVTPEAVSDFVCVWGQAVRAYMGIYRVVGLVPGVGEVTLPVVGVFEIVENEGYTARRATEREVQEIEEAIRGGWVDIRVMRLNAPGADRSPLLVLHQATGVFRPFNYFRFMLPDRTGPGFQHYPYDPAQVARHG